MTQEEKRLILDKAKQFFKDKIIKNHQIKTRGLRHLRSFKPNPFLEQYLANFVFGSGDAVNVAKALIYPRVLGTSITTIFGTQMQSFCKDVLNGYASTTKGIDIEFIDQVDGRKKYCQIKAGPQTINNDDITTIRNHFKDIRHLARTNGLRDFNPDTDCIVGVFYGTFDDLAATYITINETHPVFVGQEFWKRLTGDDNFYQELIAAIAEVAQEVNGTAMIDEVIQGLSDEIANRA